MRQIKLLSKKSRRLHKAVDIAMAKTQTIEKRRFTQMEPKTGLAKPVGPLQGMPRKKKVAPLPKGSASEGSVAKKASGTAAQSQLRKPKNAALSQALSPKRLQKLRQAIQKVAAKTAPGLAAMPSASVSSSLFRLAKGAVAVA